MVVSHYRQDLFFGRKAELKTALNALQGGKHVFVHGPFGIGKTSFGRHLLSSFGGPPLSISLMDSPSEMAEKINVTLSNYQPRLKPKQSFAGAIYFHDRKTRIKSFRALKSIMERFCVYQFPILIDDFRSISTSKLAFLSLLSKMGFRFILAIESGFNKKQLESLLKSCPIFVWIDLPKLNTEESKELILSLFDNYGLSPDPERMRLWLQSYQGHPLALCDRVREFLRSSAGG